MKNESRLSALSDRVNALEGQLHDPDEFRRFALDHLLVAEVAVLADPAARTEAVMAGVARRDAGICPVLLHRIEREAKRDYPHDAERYSSDAATRLQADIRLAAHLRAAVSKHF